MPRTVDEAAHARRREHFLDVAGSLIEAGGYERMSVQDVLDGARASRGAFYHYFASKQELLAAVVDRFAEAVAATLEPIAADPRRSAVDKLGAVFAELSARGRADLVHTLRVWYDDGNERVRQRARGAVITRLAVPLTTVVAQGVGEGVFDVPDPEAAGRLLATLTQDLNDDLADATTPLDRTVGTYVWAMERILGVPPGSLVIDPDPLRVWFPR